ncbi:MAG: hypothetical protein LBD77_04050, partial [Bifidobacteriaceae bacterium]|nr:hypothetical protein [Bifidobacteriaceae bacterium]
MMFQPNRSGGRRPGARALVAWAAAAALSAAAGVGVWGLVARPGGDAGERAGEPSPGVSARPPAPDAAGGASPAAISDSEAFARWAASALFDWDTATMSPSDVAGKLMAVADPAGEGEAAGLASDIG